MALNKFQIPTNLKLPKQIENELLCLWNKAYGELYEEDWIDDSEITITEGELDTDILKILAFYGDASDENSLGRFIYINWILCISVKQKIAAYLSDSSEYDSVLKDLELWSKNNSYSLSDAFANRNLNIGNAGAVMEAILVYENMLKIPARQNIIEIVADSIDSCLQGTAICHGSIDKRAIFNWLIVDVFPSAYCHKLPSYIYTGSFDINNWEYFERV
jgi:hypothetical protein